MPYLLRRSPGAVARASAWCGLRATIPAPRGPPAAAGPNRPWAGAPDQTGSGDASGLYGIMLGCLLTAFLVTAGRSDALDVYGWSDAEPLAPNAKFAGVVAVLHNRRSASPSLPFSGP